MKNDIAKKCGFIKLQKLLRNFIRDQKIDKKWKRRKGKSFMYLKISCAKKSDYPSGRCTNAIFFVTVWKQNNVSLGWKDVCHELITSERRRKKCRDGFEFDVRHPARYDKVLGEPTAHGRMCAAAKSAVNFAVCARPRCLFNLALWIV